MERPRKSGRSSVRPADEQLAPNGDLQADTMPPADVDMGDAAVAPAPRGPVSVGRSLEIVAAPDVCMEFMVDKLKLLNYEIEFCRKKKPYRKSLTRQYFAVAFSNPSEQFFYFTSLTAWLLTLAGVEVPPPKEFDDPNATCVNLLNAVRKLGFAPPNYHPSKLTVGSGREVCGVLDGLVDFVLEKRNFQYRRPMYRPEAEADEAAVDEEAETAAMEGADELATPEPVNDEEEEEEYMGDAPSLGRGPAAGNGAVARSAAAAAGGRGAGALSSSFDFGATGSTSAREAAAAAAAEVDIKAPLISRVDPVAWRVELERVAPKLRITVAADSRDWRSHLDEAHQHQETIAKAWPDSRLSLEKLRADLNGSLEKLMTREKVLNEQFEHLMQQYRGSRQNLTGLESTVQKRTDGVADRQAEIQRIGELLEEIRANMDEKGQNISDSTPVMRIKNAIKKLNEELHDMEVRIGVVSHTLLQLSLKNRREMQTQPLAPDEDEDD